MEVNHVRSQLPTAWLVDHTADCAIVLTGAAGRVREGFDLLSQGNIKKLILSGVFPYSKLRDIFPQWPYYGNINEADVILEKRSSTTYGNAQQTLPLIEALRCRDLVLITDRIHMYRALRTFRAIYPPDIPIYDRATIRGTYESEWSKTLAEALKSLFYSIWAYF